MRLGLFPESEELSHQLSGAGAAPWPAYKMDQRATMMFDGPKSEAVNDPDKEERLMLRAIGS